METKHEKKDIRRSARALVPALALLASLTVTVNIGMFKNADNLDKLYGKGKPVTAPAGKTAPADAIYYPRRFAGQKESLAAAEKVSRRISDGGIVLLKNNGILPLKSSVAVSPFGLRYCLPFYGGGGSCAVGSGGDHFVSPSEGLHAAFPNVNALLEARLRQAANFPGLLSDTGTVAASRPMTKETPDSVLYEFRPEFYKGTEESCRGTIAIIYVGRKTGENEDASTLPYNDGGAHMLALSKAEQETVSFAKSYCSGVVVVIASSAPMQIAALEDDSGVDAILWIGGAGGGGYASLGDILAGNIVPSGRTPDLWPADFTESPSFANQDDGSERFIYTNALTTLVGPDYVKTHAGTPFHEYEEGIYVGYRYYETAWDTGFLHNYYDRRKGVLYPFGYGLSYTQFSREIIKFSDHGDKISLTIRVRNIGESLAGRDVIQIYVTPPYTDFDCKYSIEKASATLAAFSKTGLLPPGAFEDIELSFPKEDMASYCYTRDNGDGSKGCYVLEEGTYIVSLRDNCHDTIDTRRIQIPDTIWYDYSHPRKSETDAQAGAGCPAAATNRFEDLNSYMSSKKISTAEIFSRGSFGATFPTAPSDEDRVASEQVVSWTAAADTTTFDSAADPRLGNIPGSLTYIEGSPICGADNGLVLADMRGKNYNDPVWDVLLDQLDFGDEKSLAQCLFLSAYRTGRLKSLGKPESSECDGPQGLTRPDKSGRNWLNGVCAYPAAPVMAATWDLALLNDLGHMVGEEALIKNITGWYAPALNLHRSPFGGRISEYYSEDPLLAGSLGAQVVSGAGDMGLTCIIKHLGPMDMEANKNPHTAAWMTEQTLREIYLRPFEIVVKTAEKSVRYLRDRDGDPLEKTMRAGNFIMAGDCGIGAKWAASSYELITEVLRREWGFEGAVMSDMHLNGNANQVEALLRAGCDALMSAGSKIDLSAVDYSSPTGRSLLRRAVKNLCYPLVSSSLMQGVAPGEYVLYTLSRWRLCLIVIDTAIGILIVSVGLWLLVRAVKAALFS